MHPSRLRGRIGGLRAQLLFGLIVLLVLTLALVAVATVQFHKRDLQRAVAEEARRHVDLLTAVDSGDEMASASAALEEQPAVLHAGSSAECDQPVEPPDHDDVWIADYDDQPAMWAVADADGASDATLVVLSLDDAQAAIDDGRRALVLYLAVTLLFVTLFGYAFFSFVVIRPLRALSVATQRAADGDLASPVTVLPRNEFGEVGRQFNTMLERLDDQREQLRQRLQKLHRAHEELQQTQESLIRSEKMASVGELAAGIAHEIGNPLAAVMGYADLLRDRSLDADEADEIADRTLDQLERIRGIIRQLLDYSRTDSQREPTVVDIGEVIEEAAHLVRATPEGSDADVEFEEAGDDHCVYAVGAELEQVLLNLFFNAVKAMEDADIDVDERRLEVTVDGDDEQVVIDVCDSGPGIDTEVQDKIFEPFFTTRDPGEGTGLGLAIAQRLVSRNEGTLTLVSSDRGARFRITMPAADDDTDASDRQAKK